MTLFKKLFGQKQQAPAERVEPLIDKMTFIEDRHPDEIFQATTQTAVEDKAPVLEALNTLDYYAMGRKDGYEEHEMKVRQTGIELIIADFRMAFYKAIQELDFQEDQLRVHLTEDVKEAMPDQYARMEAKLRQLEKQKAEVRQQIDISTYEEGFVEHATRLYRAGFDKGYALYVEEKLIFEPIKTL